jgi:uncharacterized protein (TIGR02145 family)
LGSSSGGTSGTSSSANNPSSSGPNVSYGELLDGRDGRTYRTIVIGGQEWMAQNLDFGTELTSDSSMPSAGSVELASAVTKYCFDPAVDCWDCVEGFTAGCGENGAYYQWHMALALDDSCRTQDCTFEIAPSDHRGICPAGWHVPSSSDWAALALAAGGDSLAGATLRAIGTRNAAWNGAGRGDSLGFSALPAGDLSPRFSDGSYTTFATFSYLGKAANFWSAGSSNGGKGLSQKLAEADSGFYEMMNYGDNELAASVRCLKN